MNDKKWYKTWWIWVITIIVIALIVLIPIIINESYKANKGYITLWGAEDVLAYVATIMSVISTTLLGMVAIWQSITANEISDRLLKIEEINAVPSLCVVENKCDFVEYCENSVHLKLVVQNISNGVIDIKNVSNINLHMVCSDKNTTLSFCEKCLEYSTLLPKQEKQLDFCVNKHNDNKIEIYTDEFLFKNDFSINLVGVLNIELGYKGAKNNYTETIKVCCNPIPNKPNNPYVTRSDYMLN